MRYGVELAPWGELADPRRLAGLAALAEATGWDGVFLWDAMLHDEQALPKADAWIALAAVATATSRVRIGPMVTPLPRRRPWHLAREAVTLDWLSGGRLTLGVGLGDPSTEEFAWFGERGVDHPTRARMLDEGLAILDGLWRGEPFAFAGAFYRLREMRFQPMPLQRPRVPIWVGGWWPHRAPVRRAARWDGVYAGRAGASLAPEELAEIVALARSEGAGRTGPFDVAAGDRPDGARLPGRGRIEELAAAGATWWVAKVGARPMDEVEQMVREGPPR